MECFSHIDAPAVGICKTCGRAICRKCAIDFGIALACCDVCADEARELHEMNQRGKKIFGIGATQPRLPGGVLIWLLFAMFFGGSGLYLRYFNAEAEWVALVFAGVSLLIAFIVYRRARQIGFQY
jgi:hypothetical protein